MVDSGVNGHPSHCGCRVCFEARNRSTVDHYKIVATNNRDETIILFHWNGKSEYGLTLARQIYKERGPLGDGLLYDFRAIKLEL